MAANATSSPVSIEIPVNIFGAHEVYTLISSYWGEKQTGTFASIEFIGSDDGYLKVDLDGNIHIRDYNLNPSFTTNYDQNWTKQVWVNNYGQHIDMQTFLLPSSFMDENLVSIRLSDSGNTSFQRTFIGGVTVSNVPLPPAFWLFGSALLGLVGFGRRQAT